MNEDLPDEGTKVLATTGVLVGTRDGLTLGNLVGTDDGRRVTDGDDVGEDVHTDAPAGKAVDFDNKQLA